MSTLHTVNKSPFERNALTSCLDHVLAGDVVLLIEDGVVAARKGNAFAQVLSGQTGASIYALAPDLAARGIKKEDLAEGVQTVDYGGFVDLAGNAARVCAWL